MVFIGVSWNLILQNLYDRIGDGNEDRERDGVCVFGEWSPLSKKRDVGEVELGSRMGNG